MKKSAKKYPMKEIDSTDQFAVLTATSNREKKEPTLPDAVYLAREPKVEGRSLRIIVVGPTPDSVTCKQTQDYVISLSGDYGFADAGLDPINSYYFAGTDENNKNIYCKDFVFYL